MPDETELTIKIKVESSAARKGLREASSDVDRLAKRARAFSKAWGVSFKDAYEYLRRLGYGTKELEQVSGKSFKGLSYNITFVAWHFRYLGNIFSRVSRQMKQVIGGIIDSGVQLEESFFSIRAASALYGEETERVMEVVQKLARTGLVPLTDAASIVRNLLMTGLGIPEIERFLYRYLDVASLTTSGMGEMKKSLELMTTSILRGTTVLATDRTARMIWKETNDLLQKSLGVTLTELEREQRALAILTTLEKEFAGVQGLHRAEMNLTQASLQRMTTAWQELTFVLYENFKPIVDWISRFMIKIIDNLKSLFKALGPIAPLFLAINTAIFTVSASLFFLMGVFLSFRMISRRVEMTLTELTAAHAAAGAAAAGQAISVRVLTGALRIFQFVSRRALPILILFDLAVTALSYALMKGTGAFEEQKKSQEEVEKQINKLRESFKRLGEEQEEIIGLSEKEKERFEDAEIAHRRKVEDIMEQLERETSKGLWADQMRIKDLRKRLDRENEDWQRYLERREKQTKEEGGLFEDLIKDIEEVENAAIQTQKGVEKSFSTITNKLMTFSDTVDEIFSGITNMIVNFPITIQEKFGEILTYLTRTWWPDTKEALKGAFIDFLTYLETDWVPDTKEVLRSSFIDFSTYLTSEWIPDTKEVLKGSFDDFLSYLKTDWVPDTKEVLKDIYKGLETTVPPSPLEKEFWERIGWKPPFLEKWFWEPFKFKWPWQYQFGGVVPGPMGAPRLALVHGGERIVPAHEVSPSNITININRPIVREEEDIQRLADAVKSVLSQRQRWARLGAY